MGKLYIITKTTLTDLDSSRHDLREATQAEIDAAASEQMRQDAAVGRAMRLLATSTFTVIVQPQRVIVYAYDENDGWSQLAVEPDFYSAVLVAAGMMEE